MTTITLKYLYQEQPASRQVSITNIWQLVSLWLARSHQRQQLAELSYEQLLDMGITRECALEESAKPFWHA